MPGRKRSTKNAARKSMKIFCSELNLVSSEVKTKSLFLMRLTSGRKMNFIASSGEMPAR